MYKYEEFQDLLDHQSDFVLLILTFMGLHETAILILL